MGGHGDAGAEPVFSIGMASDGRSSIDTGDLRGQRQPYRPAFTSTGWTSRHSRVSAVC